MKILPLLQWRLHQHIHTHTLDTQFPRFAFQIAYWHSPSFLPLLLLFSPTLMPLRHWFHSIPFNIPHHQETQGCFKKKIYIYRGKKWGKGEKEKKRKKRMHVSSNPTAAPACTRVAFCSVHINASYPPKLFPLEWTYQRFSASLERAVPDNTGFPCQFLPTRLWQHFLPDTLILTHAHRRGVRVYVCASAVLSSCCASNAAAFRLQGGRENPVTHLYSTLLIRDSCGVMPSL